MASSGQPERQPLHNGSNRAAPVQRRPSKKNTSHDRHGKVFGDNVQGRSVRAVTPDSPVSTSAYGPVRSTPNGKSSRPCQASSDREHPASPSNTDEEGIFRSGRRRKSRTNVTMNDGSDLDAASNSIFTKTKRFNSFASTPQSASYKAEKEFESIGFPSVIPSPLYSEVPAEQLSRPAKSNQRPFSPPSSSGSRQGTVVSPSIIVGNDSKKILQLMKATSGRMHGILFYRHGNSEPWASGYCAINVAPGSLVCQVQGDIRTTRTLVPDLRGCHIRTRYDSETQNMFLSIVTALNESEFDLRPPVPETFDSWLAALLCWQPLKPKTLQHAVKKSVTIPQAEKRRSGPNRVLALGDHRRTTIIKVGKLLYWDGPVSVPPRLPRKSAKDAQNKALRRVKGGQDYWQRISCTLHENGDLKLLSETDSTMLTMISLSSLSRSAVQRLHHSVLGRDYCVAIFPHLAPAVDVHVILKPVYLAFESSTSSEVWFVLFRALTVPEMYGAEREPQGKSASQESGETSDSLPECKEVFRVERTLSVRLIEARLNGAVDVTLAHRGQSHKAERAAPSVFSGECYADVMLGNDIRGRTAVRTCDRSVLWAEEFNFAHLPSDFSTLSILIKDGSPTEKEWTMVAHGSYETAHREGNLANAGRIEVSSHDTVYGRVELQYQELEHRRELERRWPILDHSGQVIGDLLMRTALRETTVLMQNHYRPVTDQLLNFSNSLTPQIAEVIGIELKQLSEVLLDIFQVQGKVSDWISNLVEEEIDGVYKAPAPPRLRFMGRVHSGDSADSSASRELMVRDLSRSANNEAALLFRGNSLVTKALDAHMRRIGKEYLQETLGAVLREIIARDPDCEVDPVRMKQPEQRETNWVTLTAITQDVWDAIAKSAGNCPSGLRLLFRHIRSCAEDRYGSFIRTVKYTSVSGFLFLRFFCPAILNPELFGLLSERPPERPRRTFTLLAKSLIVLANMAKFGAKEPWMEPMNRFLIAATPSFKKFVDDICAFRSSPSLSAVIDPQNATPLQIITRLPPMYQEGCLSLPYLLDSAKLHANLVELWVEHAPSDIVDRGLDPCIMEFDAVCRRLSERSRQCPKEAVRETQPGQNTECRWQDLLAEHEKQLANINPFEDSLAVRTTVQDPPIKHISRSTAHQRQASRTSGKQALSGTGEEYNASPASMSADWDNNISLSQSELADSGMFTVSSTNSSTISLGGTEKRQTQRAPGSRDGSTKNRLFELVSRPARRKTEQ